MEVEHSYYTDGSSPGYLVVAFCSDPEYSIQWDNHYNTWPLNGKTAQSPNSFYCQKVPYCDDFPTHEGAILPNTSCGMCSSDHVRSPGIYSPDSGSSIAAPYECMLIAEPAECLEVGKLSVPVGGQYFCNNECSLGSINGVCVGEPEPDNECSKDSPDYRGQVVLGYGKPPINACGDFDQCSGDKPGQVGFVNGELRCIPEDYGVPQCQQGSSNYIASMDEYGFACLPLTDVPEDPEVPEEPNEDTTGDGEPDTYNPDSDPNINRKQLDKLNKGQSEGNQSLKNLEGAANKLNELTGKGNRSLRDIEKNTGSSANSLKEINDSLSAPEGGFSLEGLGSAPEFTETIDRLSLAFFEHPTIQSVSSVPTLASSSSCPVYTFPANEFWSAHTMDIHCSIFENYRAQLSGLFMFFWTVVAVFIFLRA